MADVGCKNSALGQFVLKPLHLIVLKIRWFQLQGEVLVTVDAVEAPGTLPAEPFGAPGAPVPAMPFVLGVRMVHGSNIHRSCGCSLNILEHAGSLLNNVD